MKPSAPGKWQAVAPLFFLLLCAPQTFANPTKPYRGAELRTRASYLYGRFEVRMKAAWGSGLLSSFFTYNDINPNQRWNEIDIEIMGRYPDDVQFNIIPPDRLNHVHHQFVPFDPRSDFHTYAIEWTDHYVAWFVDGQEVHRQTGPHVSQLDRPQKIMMNIWPPAFEDWAGPLDPSVLPARAYYDWVSYASYTPGQGSVGTDNNFTPQWRDDFDSWDQSRWAKATHTWDGNNSQFTPENAVFRDGMMILCLTDPEHTGLVDPGPPSVLWARYEPTRVVVQFSEEVDPASAENPSNYAVFPGSRVLGASLAPCGRRVFLEVDSLSPDGSYNLAVSGIRDLAEPPHVLQGAVVPIALVPELSFPVRINCGGDSLPGFHPDQPWSETVAYGYEEGKRFEQSPLLQIAGTDLDALYRSERWGLTRYNVRVPDGTYNVRLHFAENYFDAPGKRIFDVFVEDRLVADNLDLFARAGKHAALVLETAGVSITDRELNVHFGAERDYPLLNGLEIELVTAGVRGESMDTPRHFEMLPVYPNPAGQTTQLAVELRSVGNLEIQLYDLRGRLLEKRRLASVGPGLELFRWFPSVPSGVYVLRYRFFGPDGSVQSASQRVTVVR